MADLHGVKPRLREPGAKTGETVVAGGAVGRAGQIAEAAGAARHDVHVARRGANVSQHRPGMTQALDIAELKDTTGILSWARVSAERAERMASA